MTAGELDLIAFDGPVLVFVEVKQRSKGQAHEALTPTKGKRLVAAAQEYVAQNAVSPDVVWRFDAVVFDGQQLSHFRSIFED